MYPLYNPLNSDHAQCTVKTQIMVCCKKTFYMHTLEILHRLLHKGKSSTVLHQGEEILIGHPFSVLNSKSPFKSIIVFKHAVMSNSSLDKSLAVSVLTCKPGLVNGLKYSSVTGNIFYKLHVPQQVWPMLHIHWSSS